MFAVTLLSFSMGPLLTDGSPATMAPEASPTREEVQRDLARPPRLPADLGSAVVRPFLLLSSRAEDLAADGEYEAFLRFSGLPPERLRRIRMEAGPLPAIDLDDFAGVLVGGGPFNSSDPPLEKSEVQRRVERELSLLLDEIVADRKS